MRKFQIFIVSTIAAIFLLSGCGLLDTDDVLSSVVFSPPDWIIGTWEETPDDPPDTLEFTENDVIMNGSSEKDAYDLENDYGDGVVVTEDEASDTLYQYTWTEGGTDSHTHTWEKVDDTTLIEVHDSFVDTFIKIE